jgi:hypothetical protein
MFTHARVVGPALVVLLVPMAACELAFPVNESPHSGQDASTAADSASNAETATDTGNVPDTSSVTDTGSATDTGSVTDTGSATDTGGAMDAGSATDGDATMQGVGDADAAAPPTDGGCEATAPPNGSACRMFHNDCPATQGCWVAVVDGGADFVCQTLSPKGFGALCNGVTDCAQDLACTAMTAPDGSIYGECRYWCIVEGGAPPFDMCGLDPRAPGSGGCPANFSCSAPVYAPWLGICG